jgi:hypothetical protein
MSAKVKVVGDETGNVINQSVNNPEYGYVRVEQTKTMFDENSFLRRKSVSALIHGYMEDLKAEGYFVGQELPGKVVVIESIKPFSEKNPSQGIKKAGNTGIVCTIEGLPIYRKTIYSQTATAEDVLVKHDNVEVIRNAFTVEAKPSAVNSSASDEFDID